MKVVAITGESAINDTALLLRASWFSATQAGQFTANDCTSIHHHWQCCCEEGNQRWYWWSGTTSTSQHRSHTIPLPQRKGSHWKRCTGHSVSAILYICLYCQAAVSKKAMCVLSVYSGLWHIVFMQLIFTPKFSFQLRVSRKSYPTHQPSHYTIPSDCHYWSDSDCTSVPTVTWPL